MNYTNGYFSILLLVTLSISGCAAEQDLQDMKQAKAAYEACLDANPKDPTACKHEKETYETAGEAYDGLKP